MNHGNLPSSFASAAAGQNASRDGSRGGRNDGRGSGDWARRDGRVPAGTLTFRRPSSNSLGQATQPQMIADPIPQSPSIEANARGQTSLGGERYSKEHLLQIYKSSKPDSDPSRLFMYGWNPGAPNGASSRSWFKSDNQPASDASLCWDASGEVAPIGLQDYTPEEREAFANDINSTVKPPQKDLNHGGGAANGRKLLHGQANPNPGLTSPTARPGTRRREAEGSGMFGAGVTSPNPRQESSWFRRVPDVKEAGQEEVDEEPMGGTASVFSRGLGGIIRSNTAGSSGGSASAGLPSGASSSIWNQAPATPNTAAGNAPPMPTTGSFGFFSHQPAPSSAAAIGEKRFGAPRESRLAHLIPNNGAQNQDKPQDSPGLDSGRGWPNRVNESDAARPWKDRSRTDTDPYGGGGGGGGAAGNGNLTGSAALGGLSDSPPGKHGRAMDSGKPTPGDFGMSQLTLGGPPGDDGPLSPSVTNPYLSPQGGRRGGTGDEDTGSDRDHGSNFGGPRGFGGPGGGGSGFDSGGDRSQTSSTGPRAYPGTTIGGGLSGWPAPSSAGPDRTGFSNYGSIFAPMAGDGGAAGMSGAFGPMFGNRPPKMQSLFPGGGMGPQDHLLDDGMGEMSGGLRQTPNPLGAIGRGTFGLPPRENDSPIRAGGRFDGFFSAGDSASRPNPIYSASEATGMPSSAQATPPFGGLGGTTTGPPFNSSNNSNNNNNNNNNNNSQSASSGGGEPQQRQMVMPDRMRWTYLDPQGNVQGPFTGCEMHDWYKAMFFTPDLRVKKLEDPDFEPLGVMIRRIGNSREPFLVPQVGVAHGPPAQSGPFSPPSSGIIPPLSGVFPSFGRTLTAEEQNNLERRKQEEQYMLAQQREFQIRQQSMNKMQQQQHMGNAPMLQHQSSAHSLHSQPSFGNMASSMGMSPINQMPMVGSNAATPNSNNMTGYGMMGMGPMAGSGMSGTTTGPSMEHGDDEAKWRGEDVQIVGGSNTGAESSLRSQLPRTDELTPDSEGFRDRLREFEQLRTLRDAEAAAAAVAAVAMANTTMDATMAMDIASTIEATEEAPTEEAPEEEDTIEQRPLTSTSDKSVEAKAAPEPLTMAQQVKRASQQSSSGIPMPFPPAADAQSNVLEQYNSSPSSETAETNVVTPAPPPLAPWAKDPAESQKGPSLKEIQEAEARKAAKAEEIAAAQRKRQVEQEVVALREREKAATAQAPGLPTTSTWGSGSPVVSLSVTATVAAAAWAKPTSTPASVGGGSSAPGAEKKKTLADIQREEELRKQKAKEIAHQAGAAAPSPVIKSYANLAGVATGPSTPRLMHASPQQPGAPSMAAAAAAGGGGGWATVGANGKAKIPTGPANVSRPGPSAAAVVASGRAAKPVAKTVPVVVAASADRSTFDEAQEDFKKWVAAQLKKGLTDSMDIDALVETLYTFPLDATLIADVIYMHSKTMDGRHFAEEFIRRKKLADKGVVEKQATGDDEGGEGWSEVVKRGGVSGPTGADVGVLGAGFKVVPGRKKGKK